MSVDFTVSICTYNGANRVPEVLDKLQKQTGTEKIKWEVIVVDNNSDDNTASVVFDYVQSWRKDSELRYVFEGKQGVSYARNRAVKEARSRELIGFLDDDNLPAENWLAEAYRFGQEHPQAGAYGGVINAKLDEPLPSYFEEVKVFLAISNRGSIPFCYERSAKPRRIPAAPGSVIRKQAWQDCVPEKLLLQGRDEKNKTMLGACEDLEVMYRIQNGNWEVWHNPKMEIWHHIPAKRLEKQYLLEIARTSGLSNHALRIARLHQWQRPVLVFLTPLYLLSDSRKVLTYYLQHRHKLTEDIGTACEFESKLGQLLSPFVMHQWL
ncbi:MULTISPECIES: hormogonium polysaccharide biosynthesis glycosyltransferase HpsE [unclassified Coleofasciculus]|uniref:hormogonium polysaccharide biosynthesis glycosyltransferase HpsE n=1 Tax=unclassified Coleofasciculus TaxID=2692782 RepID=UPI00187E54BE|nr:MULTISPECIES: hormogonium polysaccharide biosynthesis glycosyltransferase HpsE [unclassified Coleofasciculus]MBE9129025.1 glycosyltransferase family 2 protein [Coleofasciculus sp. LEGE 07081]MBE9147464.1 glycosyltransferase family 2 protein [Coleofasciculus sp. LEGE 07092]